MFVGDGGIPDGGPRTGEPGASGTKNVWWGKERPAVTSVGFFVCETLFCH